MASTAASAPPDPTQASSGTWLSRSLLLVVGRPEVEPGRSRATLTAGEDSTDVDVRCITLARGDGSPDVKVITATLPDGPGQAPAGDSLRIRGNGEGDGSPVRLTDLNTILEGRLANLGPRFAAQVLELVSSATGAPRVRGEGDVKLSSRLNVLRNALRPRLPAVAIESNQPLCGNVDVLIAIDDAAFFVKGWMRDGEARIARLTAVTPEGERIELLERLHRSELPEFEKFAGGPYSDPVDAAWFLAYFETRAPSRIRRQWVFELENEAGRAVEMAALPEVTDIPAARAGVLRSVPSNSLPDDALMSNHIFPAIDRIQARARDAVEIAGAAQYGQPPESPDISIVVPLYQRIDLLEHQLLQFERDPEVQAEELIYVLDSPELDRELAGLAYQLARMYRTPFQIVTMARNAGFGAATNAGASLARGRLLVLLNSDVLPARPGWLGAMLTFHAGTPNIGALGPKLLYEDDSLQHAGLYFDMSREGPTAGSWANMHYFKGLHKDLPAANVARAVPAVTAACMMIEKALYEQVGGLPDVYVQGDYEDSELCLRLLEAGRENWYLPAVELYHLEGTSYSPAERDVTGAYNRWLQTRRSGAAIEDAMARYSRT